MNSVIKKAIDRHGGIDAYNRIDGIVIRIEQLSGFIPFLLGIGRSFPMPTTILVRPHERRATFHGVANDGSDVVYHAGSVTIKGSRLENYRQNFNGLRRLRIWSMPDAAYFFGYALCDYFGYPFTLPNYQIVKVKRLSNGNDRVVVRFPIGADTHSRIQAFQFDSTGLLMRHDYCADVLGPFFSGSQHHLNHRFDLPIVVAEARQVTFRIGSWASPFTVLRARFKVESIQSRPALV